MNDKFSEDKIKNLLKEMPYVNGKLSKDEFYQKISHKINENQAEPHSNKRTWLIPSFASLAVVVLLVIFIQGMLPSNDEIADSGSNNITGTSVEEMPSIDGDPESSVLNEGNANEGDPADIDGDTNQDLTIMESMESKVMANTDGVSIIYGAALDSNVSMIIPISFVVDQTSIDDVESYYNHLSQYVQEEKWGVFAYPFENLTFDIRKDDREVIVTIPSEYQFGGAGATIQGLFEPILSTLFQPYQIDTAVFEYENQENGSLDMLGEIDSSSLTTQNTQLYKIYKHAENTPSFLVPLNFSGDIRRALDDMRNPEYGMNVHSSIPEEYSFSSIQPNGEELFIEFDDTSRIADSQETMTMIEAIMMTAKSFGYKSVRIEAEIEQVGPYRMNESINVPEVVNPIYLN